MARNLLETITERAYESFGIKPDSPEKVDAWYDHWFNTADNFKQELTTEGLIKTAASVDELIKQQKRMVGRV
jgi:hypothetical protein